MRIIGIFFLLFLAFQINAQTYTSAIGIKTGSFARGGFGGLNFKHFISSENALEITVGGWDNYWRAQVFFEWQKPTGWTENLDWYIGLGGGIGAWSKNYWAPGQQDKLNSGLFIIGSGVIGLDYTLPGIPINLALDTGPNVGIINARGFGWGGGLAIRYVLK